MSKNNAQLVDDDFDLGADLIRVPDVPPGGTVLQAITGDEPDAEGYVPKPLPKKGMRKVTLTVPEAAWKHLKIIAAKREFNMQAAACEGVMWWIDTHAPME